MRTLYDVVFDIVDSHGCQVGGGNCQVWGRPVSTTTSGAEALNDQTAAIIRDKLAAQGQQVYGDIVITSLTEARQ
ncbi:hypothetical protein ABT369_39075 [Dactylosporangium sp. NPDC000244]|uniref:hypothetical protein n=1 Tax=Dactylosporangium sp. NPDC000244 TaxID=3154365 RepID=UPI003328B950